MINSELLPAIPVGTNKAPLITGWQANATMDPEQIRQWGECFPGCYYGRPEQPGEVTLDVDNKGGTNGSETLADLISEYPDLRAAFDTTLCIRTPSGGFHYKFLNPQGFDFAGTPNMWPGLDLRVGEKNFCLIPPSTGYTVVRDNPRVVLPDIFHDLYLKRRSVKHSEEAQHDADTSEHMYVNGERTEFFIRQAARLRKTGMNDTDLLAALKGLNEERCDPPVSLVKLVGIVKGIQRLGDIVKTDDEMAIEFKQKLGASVAHEVTATLPRGAKLMRLADIDEKEYQFIWYPYIAAATPTGFVGAGESGKNTWMNYLFSLATTGRQNELPATKAPDITTPMNCLLFATEDDFGAKTRAEIALAGGDINRVFICTEKNDGTPFSFGDKDTFADAFSQAFADGKPGLVCVDNSGDFGDPNNDGNNYKQVTKELGILTDLARKYNAAIIVLIHENKVGNYMGSVAYLNKFRSVLSYKKANEENVRILAHEKHNLFEGLPLLFSGQMQDIPGRKYPVWQVRSLGLAAKEHIDKHSDRSEQLLANDYLRERIADAPVSNKILLSEFHDMGWSRLHLSRARRRIGGMVDIDGQKYTASLTYIAAVRLAESK
jgi:hypothetical protein